MLLSTLLLVKASQDFPLSTVIEFGHLNFQYHGKQEIKETKMYSKTKLRRVQQKEDASPFTYLEN